jgi:hypothetical protein
LCSGDDDYHGTRDIGSFGLWETERFCEKKVIVRASGRKPLNKKKQITKEVYQLYGIT